MKRLLALALVSTIAAAHAQAPASATAASLSSVRTSIGPTEVVLPVPSGFSDPGDKVPKLRQFFEKLTPPTNRLLALFVSDADLRTLASGKESPMRRYFMVQTYRAAERDTLTVKGFAEVKDTLRAQYKTMLKSAKPQIDSLIADASRDLAKQAGRPDMTLKVGEMLPLEIFSETQDSISLSALSKVRFETASVTREIPLVMAMTTLTLRGKIAYFYVYSVYDSAADIEWTRQQTRSWLAAPK